MPIEIRMVSCRYMNITAYTSMVIIFSEFWNEKPFLMPLFWTEKKTVQQSCFDII